MQLIGHSCSPSAILPKICDMIANQLPHIVRSVNKMGWSDLNGINQFALRSKQELQAIVKLFFTFKDSSNCLLQSYAIKCSNFMSNHFSLK
jgi:hypothetical protein